MAHGADPWRDTVGAPEIADRLALASFQFVPVDTGQAAGTRTQRAIANRAVHGETDSSIRTYRIAWLAEVASGASRAKDAVCDIAGGRHADLPRGVELMPWGTLGASGGGAGYAGETIIGRARLTGSPWIGAICAIGPRGHIGTIARTRRVRS